MHLGSREAYAGLPMAFLPTEEIVPKHLASALAILIKALPTKENLPSKTIEKIISIEEKIVEISMRVESALYASFDDIKKHTKEKIEIIVAFLALLELVKQGALLFEQRELFGTIKLNKRS